MWYKHSNFDKFLPHVVSSHWTSNRACRVSFVKSVGMILDAA